MADFLSLLMNELKDADPNMMDDSVLKPVEDGETVLGKMDDSLMRLYCVYEYRQKELQEWIKSVEEELEREDEVSEERVQELNRQKRRMESQMELVEDLFWTSVRHKYDAYGDITVGVRRGFQIVSFKDFLPYGLQHIGVLVRRDPNIN